MVAFSERAGTTPSRTRWTSAARTRPELDGSSTEDRLDGFFVKNLENVQGDERDVIIFSVGYGPDEHGKFTHELRPAQPARAAGVG